ncbi:MAG: glycosyltransferase family 2 protein [Candidatus Nitrosopumilus limneticus]|nr:glycosyltransferase family 2 protein [Candidatus Nitrosopumilus limneticus]MDC4213134.1 glycosyltransferase family 2 protein [Candidatus Nitrosopumilus limneticus]MDC4214251.1 glycosyltransferase family 2 protein [Candidatus Nitrosopumilus limneticus]MDC4215507.1 glycosyltransferase family 2 protein [Candidatus Nitrosopumilus limneticus]MDC4217345.1 glycosyltransferase family 2 protein [Candidatus Nitrosopumilus limneticus]
MELIIEIIIYIVSAILIGICGAWIFLIKSMIETFTLTPYLDKFENNNKTTPKVSIILPARNEEKYLPNCLDSLIDQDYENYEIIVIDDSSEDSTGKIIAEYAKKNSKIIHVSADKKPEGWMGKNWACMQGYKQVTGELLLFTDADTKHSRQVISLSVSHLLSLQLDALSVIPKLLTFDFLTKVSLPMISTFLHTRFSPINVNNPKKKAAYFFGSFFIITKKTYEQVGMHEGVKHEIIEDGALGKKVKESGHKMRIVRGDHLIDAVWARDSSTLWHALKRLMIPLYLQSEKIAIGSFFAVLFLLFIPFPIFAITNFIVIDSTSTKILYFSSAIASALIYTGAVIEVKMGLKLKLIHAVFAPLGGLVITLGFFTGLMQAKSASSVSWRGRSYSMKDHTQSSLSI